MVARGARILHVLLLSFWIGAWGVYWLLSLRVQTLITSQHVAKVFLSELLAWLHTYGVFAGPILLLTLGLGWSSLSLSFRHRVGGIVLGSGFALACSRWIAPKRVALMEALGRRFEDLNPNDDPVLELVQLEQTSHVVLMAQGLLVVLLIIGAMETNQPCSYRGIEL